MSKDAFQLSVIVPCFNERDVVQMTHQRLLDVLGQSDVLRRRGVHPDGPEHAHFARRIGLEHLRDGLPRE